MPPYRNGHGPSHDDSDPQDSPEFEDGRSAGTPPVLIILAVAIPVAIVAIATLIALQ